MVRFILMSFMVLYFSGCGFRHDNGDHNINYALQVNAQRYQVHPPGIDKKDIKVATYLKDDLQKGELILFLAVQNSTEEKIHVDYINCDLSIDAERVVVPDVRKTFKDQLPPGEAENYEIHYYPINSVDFYFRAGYRGDMKKQYSLKLDFITDAQGEQFLDDTFIFKLRDSVYQAYTAQLAREAYMQIFDFDFDSEAFAASQIDHLKKILPAGRKDEPEHTVLAITPSLTIDQVVVNALAYKYKDTLMIDVRMLNQGAHGIKLLLERALIKIDGQTYAVANHFSDSFDNGRLPENAYIFKPGTRLHLLLKYHIPFEIDRWSLAKDWLLIPKPAKVETWREWLYTDIVFRESAITKSSM